jgi:hypothetical protein
VPVVTEQSHGSAGHRPRHRRGVGGLPVTTAAIVIGPLIVPRPARSWLTAGWTDRQRRVPAGDAQYPRATGRDRVHAALAATILIAQLAACMVSA